MKAVAYLSDVSPWWTMERQEAALAEVLPSCTIYRDTLTVSERRGHHPEALTDRSLMLRPSSKRGGIVIHVASMAVLAWSKDDVEAALTAMADRNATLCSIDDGLQMVPRRDGVQGGVEAWTAARTKSRLEGAAKRGGAVSAERKKAAADAGCEKIRDRWGDRSWRTADLLAEAGVTRNTVNLRLGGREAAIRRFEAAQKRKAKKL